MALAEGVAEVAVSLAAAMEVEGTVQAARGAAKAAEGVTACLVVEVAEEVGG